MTTATNTTLPKIGEVRTSPKGVRVKWDGGKWVPVNATAAAAKTGTPAAAAPPAAAVPTLPALTGRELADVSDRRQDLSNLYDDALVSYNEQVQNLAREADQMNRQTARAGYGSGLALREDLSSRGLGFSPMFLNKGMREIAGQVAAARASITGQEAARKTALQRMLDSAKQARDLGISRLDRDVALNRSAGLDGLAGVALTPPGAPVAATPRVSGQVGARPTTLPTVTTPTAAVSATPTYGPWGIGAPPKSTKPKRNVFGGVSGRTVR